VLSAATIPRRLSGLIEVDAHAGRCLRFVPWVVSVDSWVGVAPPAVASQQRKALSAKVLRVRLEWEPDDLAAWWMLADSDRELLVGKHGATWLSFALMLKFFQFEGRFPRHAGEVPPAAVDFVAGQLGLAEGEARRFEVAGRSARRYRAQIRNTSGFRAFSRGDETR
jgi:hypothetical protein